MRNFAEKKNLVIGGIADLICFLIGLIWHQELTKIFVSRQIEVNREEAAETAGV